MWGESKSNFKMKPVVSFIDSLQGKEEERWTVEAEKKHFSSRFVEREYRENKMRKEIRKKFLLLSTMFRSSVWSHSCDTTTSYFIFVGIFYCKKKIFCSTKNPEKTSWPKNCIRHLLSPRVSAFRRLFPILM